MIALSVFNKSFKKEKMENLSRFFNTFAKEHYKGINAHLNIQITQVTMKLNAQA